MKFPLVSRSHHQAETARLKEKLEEKLAHTEKKQQQTAEKLQLASAKTKQEQQRATVLENLCEGRLRQIEGLHAEVADLRRSRLKLLDDLSRARMALHPYTGPAVPVIIGVDVEPDARVVDLNNPSWDSTPKFFKKAEELRKLLSATADGAPVKFTWFPRADPQVEKANGSATWALEHFRKDWDRVLSAGDEIGLHMHPWRWDERTGDWCQDHADEAWVLHCVRSSIAAYRAVFGTTPASYRGGDRYLSNAVMRLLEEEGVRLDLTLERMPEVPRLLASERGTGLIPDGTSIPLRAYRPSPHDFRLPDPTKTTGLGMLPLTPYEHGSLSPWLPNTVFEEALDRLLGNVGNTTGNSSPESPTHLAFVVRTSIADSPYWDTFVENTLSLARRVREGRTEFAAASEAWNMAATP
ncbi:hypothetical protein [Roseimicrobium sp. ORNL1]|uniref:hypothetical protein n=1 Tax=Roseimicrobium sp. ORNL1 TaxID=2711231 RepID=UPI0013E16409|nr:hypothetical protein [Roseimicrobium sp. ORNL1]QIF04029.1 hypothetical protein G5S37_21685 [Roseimicrobium sp. ORNL1]